MNLAIEVTTQETKDARAVAITRLVVALLTVVNFVFISLGWTPIPLAETDIYVLVSAVVSIIAVIWAWWKNNNMTKKAQQSQIYKDTLEGTDDCNA